MRNLVGFHIYVLLEATNTYLKGRKQLKVTFLRKNEAWKFSEMTKRRHVKNVTYLIEDTFYTK